MKFIIYLWALGFVLGSIQSQNLLTPEAAIKIAIENNFAIQLAENDVAVAKNNTSKEFLGYNPVVNAQAGLSSDFSDSKTNFSSGESIQTGYAFSYGANASATASYAIIDPSRDINLEQLNAILESSSLQKRFTIENNIANVLSAYYEVARLTENISLLQNTIGLSKERLERAEVQYDYGQSTKLDVLNAQVDIDRDNVNLNNIVLQLNNAKRSLNNLIGQDLNTDFTVDQNPTLLGNYDLEKLITNSKNQNTSIRLLDQNIRVNEYNYDLIEATKKPSLNGSASYSYNYSKSAPGSFFSSSQNNGLGLGLTLSYNIYDGGLRKVQKQNTQLTIEGQTIQKSELTNNIVTDLTNAWYEYQNAISIIKTEESNVATSKVNFERTEQQYKIGQVGSVEYRQAQLNLLNAENSKTNAKYNAKQIEIRVKLLSGELLE